MNKTQLLTILADKLKISEFSDYSNNGLQVDSSKCEIRKICTGVDATLPFFVAAAKAGADMVICHHGISWGDSMKYISGLNYELVKCLIENRLALWACHLPLDANEALGNNSGICRALNVRDMKPFGFYHGQNIGFSGLLPKPLSRDAFTKLLGRKINSEVKVHPFGKKTISTVGVISGGAASEVSQAIDAGLDAYVTGEADLISYNNCLQRGMNMFAIGHYASERFGVRAVGEWLKSEFGIDHEFIDFSIPY